jgi:hypothetical protein
VTRNLWHGLRRHPLVLGGIAVALLARIVFWVITDRAFEDALITLAAVHNAVSGVGLTHHPGEGHVYSFTSALSIMVPLLGELLHQGTGLIALRTASLVAVAIACIYAYNICRRLELGPWPTGFLLFYLALDWNQIYYGMAGMETQIAVAIILGLVYHLMAETRWLTGVLLGLALLVRPDFVLIVIPALVYLAWRNFRGALREGAAAILTVAPWLVFTLAYYGSIVPGTIGAKAARYVSIPAFHGLDLSPQLSWLAQRAPESLQGTLQLFVPYYEENSLISAPVPYRLIAVVAVIFVMLALAGAWSKRWSRAWPVVIAYGVLFVGYRVLFLPSTYYTWYVPPFTALVALLAAAGLRLFESRFRLLARPLIALMVVTFALPFVPLTVLSARVQHQIDERVRMPIGQYLHAHVPAGEPVISESAGYIGYYSGAKLYDYPGLTSPTVARALAAVSPTSRTLVFLVADLRAPWVVLRPFELVDLRQQYPEVYSRYRVVASFQSDVDLRYAGVELSNIDQRFYVLERVSDLSDSVRSNAP